MKKENILDMDATSKVMDKLHEDLIAFLDRMVAVFNGDKGEREGYICAVTGLPCCGCSACCEHRRDR